MYAVDIPDAGCLTARMDTAHRFKLGSRSAAVLDDLRKIMEGEEYANGGRLPNEEQLCRRFKVSRTTVRKAVACLVEEGRVVVRKRAGTFVLGPEEHVRRQASAATVAVMGYLDAEALAELQEIALEQHHLMCVYSQAEARWDAARERRFLEQVRKARHRGLIAFLSPLEPRNDALVTELAQEGMRVVHLEYNHTEPPLENFRLCDYRQAGRVAAVEFMMAGYRQLAIVRSTNAPYEVLLEEGFAAALREHDAGFDPARNRLDCRPTPKGSPDGSERLRQQLRRRTGELALFCTNDLVLDDVMALAREEGRRIPQDLGLLVFQFGLRPYRAEVDSLVYDRRKDYREALLSILANGWEKQQHLQPVSVVRRGSVRRRMAVKR